jgi:hypothetical protein
MNSLLHADSRVRPQPTRPDRSRLTLRPRPSFLPLALRWSHGGGLYRVTAWPEARFEFCYGDEWIAVAPDDGALAAAAQGCTDADWTGYLEFVPADVREFLRGFGPTRMEALQVAARCPALLGALAEVPALTAFISSHASLRGTAGATWAELAAVYERSGLFGVLEWLGLPASRQTLAILRHITEPDLPKRWLAPLRTQLWEPQTIFALQRNPAITEPQLARYCHPLAA